MAFALRRAADAVAVACLVWDSVAVTSPRIWLRKLAAACETGGSAAAGAAAADCEELAAVPALRSFLIARCIASTRCTAAFFLLSDLRQSRRAVRAIGGLGTENSKQPPLASVRDNQRSKNAAQQ